MGSARASAGGSLSSSEQLGDTRGEVPPAGARRPVPPPERGISVGVSANACIALWGVGVIRRPRRGGGDTGPPQRRRRGGRRWGGRVRRPLPVDHGGPGGGTPQSGAVWEGPPKIFEAGGVGLLGGFGGWAGWGAGSGETGALGDWRGLGGVTGTREKELGPPPSGGGGWRQNRGGGIPSLLRWRRPEGRPQPRGAADDGRTTPTTAAAAGRC